MIKFTLRSEIAQIAMELQQDCFFCNLNPISLTVFPQVGRVCVGHVAVCYAMVVVQETLDDRIFQNRSYC